MVDTVTGEASKHVIEKFMEDILGEVPEESAEVTVRTLPTYYCTCEH